MTAASERSDLDRVLTVPNGLSLFRLLLLGAVLGLLFGADARVLAAVLLAVAGATDFVDGYIARRFNQVSNLGKMLDPTVDRLVVGGSVIACVVYGAVPIWFAVLLGVRELAMSALALRVVLLHSRRIDVIFIGKAATFGLMCAIPLLLASDGPGAGWSVVRVIAWVIGLPSLACSFYALYSYVPIARRTIAEEQRLSAASSQ